MNSWYLQFVFAMVLVVNGISCDSDPEMLHCEYSGNDGTERFTVAAGADDEDALQNMSLDVNANITCGASDSWYGEALFSFKVVCPDEWQILLRVSPKDIENRIDVTVFPDEEEEEHISKNTGPPNSPIFLLSKDNSLEIKAKYSGITWQNKMFKLSAWTVEVIERIEDQSDCEVNPGSGEQIDPDSSDSSWQVTPGSQEQIDPDSSDSSWQVTPGSQGNGPTTIVSCPTHSSYDIVLISFDDNERLFNVICWEFDVSYPPPRMRASCSRMSSTRQVELTLMGNVDMSDINLGTIFFLRYAPDPSVGSRSGKSNTASIVVPIVVVLVAVFLIVALAAIIWRKRRNKQASAHAENVSAHNGPYLHNHVSSEGGDATDKSPRYVTSNAGPEGDCTVALNIRSTVNQNEDTVVYNEIGEQNYNRLFGGKEKDDYHEYNVPDRPQEKTSLDRTTAGGSGPYQELLQDGTRAVTAVNRSPGVTGPKHGVADDLHAYQDLRQDDSNVNQLPSKDTSAIENGYQALKTATPEYATLEPSPEYATLEQNDQSVKSTSDVSGPPPDKEYDMLQRSINTVGQPPSAGYGTLKPMNETDADYESPDGQPKTTSNFEDSTTPTEALPNNQPKTMHPGSYDDDDYQTPIEPAEDLTNAYPTLDNPGYQQEPDTQADEYSHLQRSLGAKLQSHPSSNHNNSDSYGKLHLNSTP